MVCDWFRLSLVLFSTVFRCQRVSSKRCGLTDQKKLTQPCNISAFSLLIGKDYRKVPSPKSKNNEVMQAQFMCFREGCCSRRRFRCGASRLAEWCALPARDGGKRWAASWRRLRPRRHTNRETRFAPFIQPPPIFFPLLRSNAVHHSARREAPQRNLLREQQPSRKHIN